MSISAKTRKILWARSGNKCAICRKPLITSDKPIVVGAECHIISEKDKGPRGDSKAKINHNGYDNLILLCSKDHKIIDENEDKFTVKKLIKLKNKHEAWVFAKLKENNNYSPFILPRIVSVQELSKVLSKVHFYNFINEDFENDKEAELIGKFFQILQDWGDILPDLGVRDTIAAGQSLQKELDVIKEDNFLLFGAISKKEFKNLGIYDVATFSISKETSSSVIKWDELLKELKNTDI